ncbi:MAG: hypothetical protein HKN50_07130 [Gammaproteobacteria bacterium]|nr:hypothetical protein [Gammaproteobacteria bacterium]
MSIVYSILLYIHIIVGFISLILFWIPIASRKGGRRHRTAGRWYANAMYAVGVTALLLSILLIVAPIAAKYPEHVFTAEQAARFTERAYNFGVFLLAISALVLVGVRHGLLTLQAKKNHALMRQPTHLLANGLLLAIGVYLAVTAMTAGSNQILFFVFAGLCGASAIGNLRYCLQAEVRPMEWLIAHLSAMLGVGIGSHTAFFVFGANRFVGELLTGNWLLIPWVGPGVIGTLAIVWLTRKYRRKYQQVNKNTVVTRPSAA